MKKFFTNDVFFAIVTWVAAFAAIPITIAVFLYYEDNPLMHFAQITRLIIAISILVTYFAYKKHSKNVMKGMIGSVLAEMVLIVISSFFLYEDLGTRIFSGVIIALVVALYVNHFIINSDHHSRPANILVNQILSLIFIGVVCAESILLVPECEETFDMIAQIITCIGQPCCVLSIICIESRLDAYRRDREKAGWTQEKGYPVGYVHQFEKDQKNK